MREYTALPHTTTKINRKWVNARPLQNTCLKNKSTMRGYTSLSYTMHDKGKKKVNIKSKEFVLLLHIHVWTLYVCSVVLNPIRHRYMIGDSYRRGSKKGGGRGSGCPWENSYLSKLAKIGLWTPPPRPWNTPPLEKILNAQFFKTYV